MSPTKRERTASTSPSSDGHIDKRPRVEDEDASTAKPSSNTLIDQRPPLVPESETSETDSETALTEDYESDNHDKIEYDRDYGEINDEHMGVVSWGWADTHFLHELNPTSQISNEQEADTSYSDTRISLWQQEDRCYNPTNKLR
ncbi:hypothetical protein NEUTE1DRAFT_141354 [Neurospora tetrasperma FGSC 2508]|uniref:Uncharacterized protein n=1 Tax=Neurospora tetrasperma (strain FGSC 2508 / ATCC MYA-4615 / P0657) TaxID=510951 RepID=F8MYK6_NEUT8|nr:uncharacterized protein NEUTE1DRAFT_141354 [Neurospora tetrasperma FGSC 2508]EGO51403.1 hypothetical protein NEUTE1DRAFT_141354 [Neurospora tetrasperma FGSC 2508]EGZ78625.1 hypothetical protein NEUTE2DRAFT_163229 [Neurospora tetrasperma FGSC 2509]